MSRAWQVEQWKADVATLDQTTIGFERQNNPFVLQILEAMHAR